MEFYGIVPKRATWVKVAAVAVALLSIYYVIINKNWFYLPFAIIIIPLAFSHRKHVISQNGVDIVYTLLGKDFHNLWTWDEILHVHKDSIKSAPNIELHISKGVINRRFILSVEDIYEAVDLIEKNKPALKVSEVNHI